jgi:hypothetical protein
MKKWFIFMLAGAMVLAITVPASALENIFGGYWRTRAFVQRNFTGEDQTEARDLARVDTRTRLYYTAKFSDNFSFVNKFEFDAVWGTGGSQYGDLGADGIAIEVKNTYADFTLGPIRTTLGTQGYVIARGFVFDDDFSGAVVRYNADWGRIPFIWIKIFEGGQGMNANDLDIDAYGLNPIFKMDNLTINPFLLWYYSDNATGLYAMNDLSEYQIGANVDFKVDPFSLWFTGIYQGGEYDVAATNVNMDVNAFLLAGGAKTSIGPVGIHGELFYASGDDDPTDTDDNAFGGPTQGTGVGQSYYWSEIMGLGIFDNQGSNGSSANQVSNIVAGNIGFTYMLMENLKFKGDVWWAQLAEDNAAGDKYLGTELDGLITYKIMDNLNLDLVAAYLFAGEATEVQPNEENPYELGARISLSF